MRSNPPSPVVDAPIGVFDSGVGGLSVLRQIRLQLPSEDLIYIADSGFAPYGDKPAALVQARAEYILHRLRQVGCKAAVVACNTVTGLSISALRKRFSGLPLVAIEPAVKPAAALTRSGVVGVLATRNTVDSPGLARLIATHANGVRVLPQACPGWVERVERGELDGPETLAAVCERVQPLLSEGADVLVLGCTHYPFLTPIIERVAGPMVAIVDPAPAVARELTRRLGQLGLLTSAKKTGYVRFWTSGKPEQVGCVISRLWGDTVQAQPL